MCSPKQIVRLTLAGSLLCVLLPCARRAGAADDIVVAEGTPGQPVARPPAMMINPNGVVVAANVNGVMLIEGVNANGVVNVNGAVVAANAKNNVLNINNQVDSWFFPRNQAEARRAALESPLALRLAELRRCCNLSDAQTKKMALAVQYDLSRFFDAIDELRRRYIELGVFHQEIQQELIPLRAKYQTCEVCGRDSFFEKTLTRLLDDEQLSRYRAVVDDRLRRRYSTIIDLVLQEFEQRCPLDSRQHETIRRLLAEGPLPSAMPDSRNMVTLVQYRLSQIPPDQLQPLFGEDRWIVFNYDCQRFAKNRDRLRQIGMLDEQ
jgi:hypothetical protein